MTEATLRKWRITTTKEGVPYLLASTVHNHPRIGTGDYGHSMPLVWVDIERGLAQTVNTLYYLEAPHPDVHTQEHQELIEKLHPKHVPPEIRRAHAARPPAPHQPKLKDDLVTQWVVERWSGLKFGEDY